MLRRKKIQMSQWLSIIAAWQVVAFFITCYDHFLLHSRDVGLNLERYSFIDNLIFNMGGAFVGSLLAGSLIIFYVNVKFMDKPYGYSILANCMSYLIIMSFIIVLIGFFWIPQSTGIHVGDQAFREAYRQYILDPYHLKDILVWSIVVAITQFVLLMNNKFGHGILWDIIRGKYHLPREETHIFMFADLNSSTAIAEKLGNERYHELLKDFFADITNPIITIEETSINT